MSIWLFDTSAFNKRADGGGADVQAACDVARFFAPDLRHYNPLFLFRKIIVDAILPLGHKPIIHNRLNKKHTISGVFFI